MSLTNGVVHVIKYDCKFAGENLYKKLKKDFILAEHRRRYIYISIYIFRHIYS